MAEIPIMRVPISMPCQARVLPGTGRTDAAVEERTECCAVDAWWMVGAGLICDGHLRDVLGDDYEAVCGDADLNPSELAPWAERHRYSQAAAVVGTPWAEST